MKRILILLMLGLIMLPGYLAAQDSGKTDEDKSQDKVKVDGPKASWDKTSYDFGKIPFKTKEKVDFTLTNSGNQPLIIVYGQSSCGCAQLDYNEAPVLPGKSTKVTITYDGKDPGDFLKTITIVTNASDERTLLRVKGTVVK